MDQLRHKRAGQYIQIPSNARDITFKSDYTQRGNNSFDINLTSLTFKGEEAVNIIQRINNGTSGGVGVFEGDVYELEYQEQTIWEGYLDYTGAKIESCNIVSVPVIKRFGSEWLNKKLDAYSYRYMYSTGLVKDSDFVNVPYTINYIPDGQQILIISLSLFVLTTELLEAIEQTAEQTAKIINASTPNTGTGITWDVGDYIDASITLAGYIAKTTALVIAIKKLVGDLFAQILGSKRNHKGIRLKTLFEKGCQQLGLTLKSSLLDKVSDWVIIPPKNHKGGEKPTGAPDNWKETGLPQNKSSFDTFGGVLRVFLDWFNADYKIKDGVFEFERRDFWRSQSSYTIPSVFTNQNDLVNGEEKNTNEMTANYALGWSTDVQDQNTLDNTEGVYFQGITEPKTTNKEDLVQIDGLQDLVNPCSLGTRKKTLTTVEKLLRELGAFADKLTSFLGNGTNFASKLDSRVGSLDLSSHFTTAPKMVVMQGKSLAKNQRDILSTNKMYYDYHFINSFATITGNDGLKTNNQYLLPDPSRVKFTYDNLLSLSDRKFCKTEDGEDAEIETLEWNTWEQSAIIKTRIKRTYTDNLKLTVV